MLLVGEKSQKVRVGRIDQEVSNNAPLVINNFNDFSSLPWVTVHNP